MKKNEEKEEDERNIIYIYSHVHTLAYTETHVTRIKLYERRITLFLGRQGFLQMRKRIDIYIYIIMITIYIYIYDTIATFHLMDTNATKILDRYYHGMNMWIMINVSLNIKE